MNKPTGDFYLCLDEVPEYLAKIPKLKEITLDLPQPVELENLL